MYIIIIQILLPLIVSIIFINIITNFIYKKFINDDDYYSGLQPSKKNNIKKVSYIILPTTFFIFFTIIFYMTSQEIEYFKFMAFGFLFYFIYSGILTTEDGHYKHETKSGNIDKRSKNNSYYDTTPKYRSIVRKSYHIIIPLIICFFYFGFFL